VKERLDLWTEAAKIKDHRQKDHRQEDIPGGRKEWKAVERLAERDRDLENRAPLRAPRRHRALGEEIPKLQRFVHLFLFVWLPAALSSAAKNRGALALGTRSGLTMFVLNQEIEFTGQRSNCQIAGE
jgi:hypothetical protein